MIDSHCRGLRYASCLSIPIERAVTWRCLSPDTDHGNFVDDLDMAYRHSDDNAKIPYFPMDIVNWCSLFAYSDTRQTHHCTFYQWMVNIQPYYRPLNSMRLTPNRFIIHIASMNIQSWNKVVPNGCYYLCPFHKMIYDQEWYHTWYGKSSGGVMGMTSVLTQHYIVWFAVVSDKDRVQQDISIIRPD